MSNEGRAANERENDDDCDRDWQCRSGVAFGAVTCHSVGAHAVNTLQTRSLVTVGAVLSHSSTPHVVSAAQRLSVTAVGARVCHSSPSRHDVSAKHARSDVGVGASASYWTPYLHGAVSVAQARSDVAVGAATWN